MGKYPANAISNTAISQVELPTVTANCKDTQLTVKTPSDTVPTNFKTDTPLAAMIAIRPFFKGPKKENRGSRDGVEGRVMQERESRIGNKLFRQGARCRRSELGSGAQVGEVHCFRPKVLAE